MQESITTIIIFSGKTAIIGTVLSMFFDLCLSSLVGLFINITKK